MSGDIGDLSLQDEFASSPTGTPFAPLPTPLPSLAAQASSSSRRGSPAPLLFTPSGSPRPPLSPRIPSSPSSDFLSVQAGPSSPSSSPHFHPQRTQRSLSRSNSSPRPVRRRGNGFSQDLGIADMAEDRRVGEAEVAKLRRWVEALVVVNFNLDVGPEVQKCVPERRWGIGVSENMSVRAAEVGEPNMAPTGGDQGGEETAELTSSRPSPSPSPQRDTSAFSSFPDTTLFNEGDLQWSFKLNDPRPSTTSSASTSVSSASLATVDVPASQELDPNGGEGGGQTDGRLFGFVLFMQKRDVTIKRGYFQKSLVLLSPLPYPSLFTNIVAFLAPKFFAEGPSVLEAACKEIASWPAPTPGATLSLPLLGTTFNVQLPSPNQSSQLVRTSLAPSSASSSQISLIPSPSRPSATSPRTASNTLHLLSPLASHLFDPRSNILASLPRTPPLKLLGSILPSMWLIWECLILAEPLLCIAPDPRTASELVWWLRDFIRPLPPSGDLRPYFHIHDASFSLLVNSHQPPPGTVLGVTNPFFRQACAHWGNVISIGERVDASLPRPNSMKQPTSRGSGKSDHPDGFKSKRKRHVDKDPDLLKRLEAIVASGGAGDFAANNELRFHFGDLTEKFLVPLNRYFASLIPTDLTPTPTNTLPPLKPFSPPAFLASLKAHGHPLTFRSKVTGGGGSQAFYEQFLRSKNFGHWLARRCGEAQEECEKRARKEGWVGGS